MRKSLVLVALFLTFAGNSEARLVKSMKKDCLVCHENWLLESKKKSEKLLLKVPIAAADEVMCLSCHDGSLADDRLAFTNFNHFSHPVNIEVPKNFPMPQQFPLKNGKLYCGTCHTPHTNTGSENKIDYTFMRIPNVNSALCIACHKENGEHGLNHPVLSDTKPLSPEQIEKVKALHGKLSSEGKVECESCHSAHEATGDKTLIAGIKNSSLCLVCHADKQGAKNHKIHVMLSSSMKPDKAIKSRLIGNKIECLTCHKMHKEENKFLTVEKAQTICASCHTAEKPALFSPHNVKGKGCLSCHLAHNAKTAKGLFAKTPSSKGGFKNYSLESKECIACHNGGVSSHPVGNVTNSHKGECVSCHNPHIWNPENPNEVVKGNVEGTLLNSFLVKRGDKLCITCHGKRSIEGTYHDLRNKKINIKNALGTSISKAGLCEACHVPHRAVGPHLWGIKENERVKEYAQEINVKDAESRTCLTCHYPDGIAPDVGRFTHPTGKKVAVDTKLPLGKGNVVTCGTCHDPHKWTVVDSGKGKADTSFLRMPEKGLCISCHKEESNVTSNAHAKIETKNVLGETPKTAGKCAACHVPHRAVGKFLQGVGKGNEKDFCLACHSKNGIAKSKVMVSQYHDHPTGVVNPSRNLPGETVECYTCHDPHKKADFLLRMPVKKNSQLCLNCHKKEDTAHSSHDFSSAVLPKKEKEIVSKFGKCALCHTPHNPKYKLLWSLSPAKGKTIGEKLCLTCHQKGGIAPDIGNHSHPIGMVSKTVQSSKLPLIDQDTGLPSSTGKMDCATCHDPHGGKDGKYLTRKPVAGNSELCISCHKKESKVIGTPHDLRIAGNKEVERKGVCSACHIPHKAQDIYLWSIPVKKVSYNVMNDLCLSCHSNKGEAKDKPIRYYFHPSKDIKISSIDRPGREGNWPIYDENGKEVKEKGAIVCETCHDPHVWASGNSKAPNRIVEGNIENSFLRNSDLKGSICIDCHGIEALVRYKLFHNKNVHAEHPFNR